VFGIRLSRALTTAFIDQALKASEGIAGLSAAVRGLIAAWHSKRAFPVGRCQIKFCTACLRAGHGRAPLFLLMNCHSARQVLSPRMAYTHLP
jgi:hypothetical protein